jgi:hypothetical protein
MQVIKYEESSIIFQEDFSGTFPPEGWTTDWWNQSYTNVAGGKSPEAYCYKYDQFNGSDYYDNYIMSPPLNLTGIKKINLMFQWASDVQYNNYCYVYLKYRQNSTKPWKDITPWYNPLKGDQAADFYEIDCYSIGESLGDEFQFKFEYIGYYNYFNYWWLDDVTIKSFNYSEEYNETIKDVEIPIDANVIVDFPNWTPTYWQDPYYENTWQEYQLKACTLLEDFKPKNNCKQKIINLYFPWMHDIEITSIDSPCEDGPGKTYPVKATIKNVGQYPECCIPINISIGESVVLDTIFSEESWDTVPPDGWTDEHKNYSSEYGWEKSNTSYSGGDITEARLPYYYALADYQFYTYALNATDYPFLNLKFKSFIDHWSVSGQYTLHAGYSHDLVTWNTVWSVSPTGNAQYDVEVDIAGGSPTVYVGFWCMGDPYYFDYWYIDDVQVDTFELVEEYTDSMCQGPDLLPGETRVFEFDDWPPAALLEGESTTNDYLIKATIEMEGDKNQGNDAKSGKFILDFWHDSKIEVASPVLCREPEEWLGFDDGTAVNSIGLTAGGTFQYAIRLTPDELAEYGGYYITSVKRHHGWQMPFSMNGKVLIYGEGTSTNPGDLITGQDFSCYDADWHEIILDEPIDIAGDEDIWVSIEVTHSSGQFPAAMDASQNYPGKGDWIYLSSWVEASTYGFYTDWLIRAGVETTCPPPPWTYIHPGIQDIEGLATNLGTFPELDLTCWAEIYDYIDDPQNGTLLYEDNITNIDLDEPLGGTQTLVFNDFNFNREGIYGLFLNMPDENDDKPRNNGVARGIFVDDTNPISSHTLDPADPDGDNDWYVSDVEVTLTAYDPEVLGVSSGVKEIKYKVNNGVIKTIKGNHGTFVEDTDKDNLPIEYWAIDNVGNEEAHHTFTINMDQTDPIIDMTFKWCNTPCCSDGWLMIYNVNATDATSGMNRVRFLLNGLEQDVISGPGPEYSWSFVYYGGLKFTITAEGYDNAGNMAYDEIIDPCLNVNTLSQKLVQKTVEIKGL